MRPVHATIAIVAFACALAPSAQADEATGAKDPKDVLRAIGEARNGVSTLRGTLVQERTIGLMKTKVKSTGRFAVVRPDRMRWELFAPDSATYVIGPEGMSLTTPGGRTQARNVPPKVRASLEDVRALVGGDPTRLSERYALTTQSEGPRTVLEGKARGESAVAHFRLVLEPDLVTPVELLLEEGPKDSSTIRFADVKKNERIPPESMVP